MLYLLLITGIIRSLCANGFEHVLTSDDLPMGRSWSQFLFHRQCQDPNTEAGPGAYRPHCWSLPLPHSPAPQVPDLHTKKRISSPSCSLPIQLPTTLWHLLLRVCVCVCVLTGFILVIVDVNIVGLHHHKSFSHQPGWPKSEPQQFLR